MGWEERESEHLIQDDLDDLGDLWWNENVCLRRMKGALMPKVRVM